MLPTLWTARRPRTGVVNPWSANARALPVLTRHGALHRAPSPSKCLSNSSSHHPFSPARVSVHCQSFHAAPVPSPSRASVVAISPSRPRRPLRPQAAAFSRESATREQCYEPRAPRSSAFEPCSRTSTTPRRYRCRCRSLSPFSFLLFAFRSRARTH